MIVICTKCQAKFRVADDKIGPRGAKVRCCRCRSVFAVQPGAPAAPAGEAPMAGVASPRPGIEVELEAAAPAHVRTSPDNPFATNPVVSTMATAAPTASATAAGVLSALPPPLPGARSAPPPPSADPFAAAGVGAEFPGEAVPPWPDPFAQAAAAPAPEVGASSLPLTDLSDLLGPQTPPEVDPPLSGASQGVPEQVDTGGLALEERLTPPPLARIGPADPFAEPDAGPLPGIETAAPALAAAPGGDPFAPAAGVELGSSGPEPLPGEEALALAYDPASLSPAPTSPEEPVSPVPRQARHRRAAGEVGVDERIARARTSRIRSVAVNAIALAALLAVAIAILAVWRSEGPFEASMLRPSALLAALRTGRASSGPFATADVLSGVYEREKGPPLLFVRGAVVSRAPAAVRGVRVTVEVVREGQVIARGAALAGALPTPEELWTAADTAALEAVARAAAARAPARIAPGDEVPFLVAIGDHPADLEGASLRLGVSSVEGSAR